jgi:hypothetical protein
MVPKEANGGASLVLFPAILIINKNIFFTFID